MPSDPGEPPAASRVMRVAGLHYGVAWRSERVKWAPEAFPVEIALPGWSLEVTKPHIAARPQTKVYNEGSAREALEPRLDAWAAELSVVYDMPMQYWFLGSELVPDVAVPMSGRNDLVIGDLVSAVDELKVVITRSELHGPTWTKPPSELAREAREYCLLPLRSQRRPEADAAYWLYEQVKRWAGSESEAARRLNVSSGVLQQMKSLSGRAFDRKAATGSRRLTSEERALLRRMVELVVRRLHLYEVGEPTSERVTLDRV
jgi:hypothetical protein